MTDEEKKVIIREKHPGRVAQGHKLVALMKKMEEEILRNKEQSTEQSTEQSSVQSNGAYISGVGILAVLAVGVCVFSAYPKYKKQANEKKDQPTKGRHML